MNTERACKPANVLLVEERRFSSDKCVQFNFGNAKIGGCLVCRALFFWNVLSRSCAFSIEVGIQHDRRAPLSLQDVLAFVAQHKQTIINEVEAQRHADDRRSVSSQDAN